MIKKQCLINSSQRFSAIFYIGVVCFIILFSANLTSAWEWDNVKSYDPINKEITIKNAFGLPLIGDNIATIKLNTPLDYHVASGYGKVAEFTINSYTDYDDALRLLKFYDVRNNMEEINRNFDYKYLTYENVVIEDYRYDCFNKLVANGSIEQVCNKIITGSHIETKEVWKDMNKNIFEGKITIGIFTDVEINDKVEWIPEFFGVEIKEWAVWTASLNVNLTAYYKLDQINGTILDSLNVNNGTNNGADRGLDGVVNKSFGFISANNDDFTIPENLLAGSASISISFWFNTSDPTIGQTIFRDNNVDIIVRFDGTNFAFFVDAVDGLASATLDDGNFIANEFQHFVGVYNGTNVFFYINATQVGTIGATTGNVENDTTGDAVFGSTGAADFLNGNIDEIGLWSRALSQAEVTQLYNGGSGITFIGEFGAEVTLISPIDNANLTSQNINFTANITDNQNVLNVTLFIDGIANETNSSGFNGTYIFSKVIGDGNHNWSILAFDNDSTPTQSETRLFNIDTLFPIIVIESPTAILDYNFVGANETLNVTFTDANLDTCWFDYNGTNITINGCLTGVKNSTLFILEENNFNMTVYANDSLGQENSSFISWQYKILEISRTFNTNALETSSQTFTMNLSANSTLTSVALVYDGTSKTTTLSNNISTATFDIPPSDGSKTFNWSFTYGAETIVSTSSIQLVNDIAFDFCNATLGVAYMNFTFKNETLNQENVNATIDSSWNIWLGSGTEIKTFTISNATENTGYDFCFSASNNTLNTNVTLVYNNVNSQQRAFVSEPILTNSTTLQTLYLLPSILGLFGQFQARDIANNPIALVKGVISRTLGGGTVNVASSLTDSSGIVIFFLNPDVLYTATFSKAGFLDNIFTFVPTTDLRFVTMGTGVSVGGSNISIETNYVITPLSSTLSNDTLTTFGFNVTGNSEITFISMNITDGNQTGFASNTNAGLGFISVLLNTLNNRTLVGVYEIRTNSENLTIVKFWTIGNEFEGDYSITKQGQLFLQYDFSDFIRLTLVLLMVFGVVIFMSSNQLADNNESKIAVVVLMIWGFSFIGWLNNPAAISTTGIAQHAKQYGIAILSTGGALFFFIRRIFV